MRKTLTSSVLVGTTPRCCKVSLVVVASVFAFLIFSSQSRAQLTIPRGRPHLNAGRTTFVADNGQPLRGPFTSTEWTGAIPASQIAAMKNLGFNAVHLYAESFDPNYPNAGSTAPGYAASRVDQIVAATRTNGLYLIITIGNGANNGNYNAAYVTNFWNFYAPRYANETHVLFEIQNEPVAWGPPYSSGSATPPGAVNMEVAAYNAIRQSAPNTPVLLFTYAVFGGTGGASSALTDIHAFSTAVFGNPNAVWTNEAVAFHGYNGWQGTSTAVSSLIGSGYPCFMTEFAGGPWGSGHGGLDAEMTSELERLGVSWLTFQHIPPTGVSDDITQPDAYSNIVVNAGLSWSPDYGNFPPLRRPYNNGGQPRYTATNWVSNFLTGTLRIQAEDFDTGGENVAYHDSDGANGGGQYRSAGVDIETTTDSGDGYDVTATTAGEWLEYSIWVLNPGYYNLALRYAVQNGGSSVQAIANTKDKTGNWSLPATGSSATWQTSTRQIFLEAGRQKLRLNVISGGFNLNWMELSPATSGAVANGTYKMLNGANTLAMTAVTSDNSVRATSYTGSTYQQWTLQHIGAGQYKVTSVGNGWNWNLFGSLGIVWWWGAGGSQSFILAPSGGGFYHILPASSGEALETSASNSTNVDQQVYSGDASQQWGIVSPSAPAFPTGLSATATSTTQIYLSWNGVAGATGYNIKRATNSGGPYMTIASGVTDTNYADSGVGFTKYYYVVSTLVGLTEGPDGFEAAVHYPKLSGSIIGTPGSWNNSGNTILKVFDNNLNTFFDGPNSSNGNGCWVGLDFGVGVSNVITRINYCPRSGFEARMVGGIFQGANQANFSGAVTLATVSVQPPSGRFTSVEITNAIAFRYVRYLSPDGGWGNVAELEFYGYQSVIPVPVPTGLSATPDSSGQISLTWNVLTNATAYNLKRSLTNGGPYAVVAGGIVQTNHLDSGLAAGTIYYYVVSALVAGNETPNGAQAMAVTQSGKHGSLIHRYSFDESGGSSVADSVGGPVWNGTLPNGGTFTGGKLSLAGNSQQFVNLPAGIVGGLSNLTLMAWVNPTTLSNWCRIFDFGNNISNSLYLTVQNASSTNLYFAITTNSYYTEQPISGTASLSEGVWHQVAVTLNGGTGIMYLDGAPIGTNAALTLRPMTLGMTMNNYLAKSQWPDPYFNGQFDEFRIHNVALSPAEIAATWTLGAGQMLNTNHPAITSSMAGNQLVLNWPLDCAGYRVQSCTNLMTGIWTDVVSPVPVILGGQWQVTLPAISDSVPVFYRLAK